MKNFLFFNQFNPPKKASLFLTKEQVAFTQKTSCFYPRIKLFLVKNQVDFTQKSS